MNCLIENITILKLLCLNFIITPARRLPLSPNGAHAIFSFATSIIYEQEHPEVVPDLKKPILIMNPVINIKIMDIQTKSGLAEKKCVPCEGNIPPLGEKEIAELKKEISGDWKVVENKKLFREFSFVNFKHTMDFVNKVADIAEEEGHHPDMHVHYGSVEVELWTHSIGGLSENDFILAAKIERIKV